MTRALVRAMQHQQLTNYTHRHAPVARGNKTGRNEPCPCRSGKKYKKCCLLVHEEQPK